MYTLYVKFLNIYINRKKYYTIYVISLLLLYTCQSDYSDGNNLLRILKFKLGIYFILFYFKFYILKNT